MLTIPWRIGANMREFAFYGTDVLAPDTANTVGLQDIQIAALKAINVKLVRFYAAHTKFTTQECIQKIRPILPKLRAAGMQAIICLDDSVRASGCFVRGNENIKGWDFGHYDKSYYAQKLYTQNYIPHLTALAKAFANDPAIFCWELGNEMALHPQPYEQNSPNPTHAEAEAFYQFAKTASSTLKSLSPNHLVSTGLVSVTHVVSSQPGQPDMLAQAVKLYALPTIDLVCIHFYAEDGEGAEEDRIRWDIEVAKRVKKPFYVGEVGASPGRWEGDRVAYHRRTFQRFKDLGAFACLVWQFNELKNDLRISDGVARMHGDFDGIKDVLRQFASNVQPFVLTGQTAPDGTEIIGGEGKLYRIMHAGQKLYAKPGRRIDPHLIDLIQGTVLELGATQQKSGLIWRKVEGWVAERNGTETVHLEAIPIPAATKIRFKVVNPGGLWIRSTPEVPTPTDANITGELKINDILEVYADSRLVTPTNYVFWRHDGGWCAEKDATGKVLMKLEAETALPPMQFRVVQPNQGLHILADFKRAQLGDFLALDTVLDVVSDSRQEKEGVVWWQVEGWMIERAADVEEGAKEAFCQPIASPLQFRAIAPNQMLYTAPQTSELLAGALPPDVAFDADPKSRQEKDGVVWAQLHGWVVERPTDVPENDPAATLQRIPIPAGFKIPFKVVLQGGIWVRSDPSIKNAAPSNKVGDLFTNQEIKVYANSRSVSADGFVWWRHDDGRKSGTAGEKVIGGWSAERKMDDPTVKLMEPIAIEPLRPEFQATRTGVMLYPWQDVNAPPLAEFLPNIVFTVDPDSRQEKDGLVWWQATAWVMERDQENIYLDKIISPTAFMNAKIPMRVVNSGGLWVRRTPQIPTQSSANIIGELDFQQVIQVYEQSRTVQPDGSIWWRHEDGTRNSASGGQLAGWSVEKDKDGKTFLMPEMMSGGVIGGEITQVEILYQNSDETDLNVNTLPFRDALFDRIPVDMKECFLLQHYGSTRESFTSCRYHKVFQGLHPGIDLGILNTLRENGIIEVRAGISGEVKAIMQNVYTPYGVRIAVGPYEVIYGHMSDNDIRVQVGQMVTPDTVLGHIANATEIRFYDSSPAHAKLGFWPHLHWEIRYLPLSPDRIINPLYFLPPGLRSILAKATVRADHFYRKEGIWTDWGSVLEQPVIRLSGSLVGPLTREQGGCT